MPRTDVEQPLENLDRRLARIEQILPTLAPRVELVALREDVRIFERRVEVLIESTRDDIRLVAEGVASLTERLERKGVI